MHVVRPGNPETGDPFSIDRLRVDEFIAYYRAAKQRFERSMAAERDATSYPVRCSHCSICDWWKQCDDRWRADDHLNLVAGIRQTQMEDLAQLEITTLQGLAEADLSDVRPERGSRESLRRVHHQARVQFKGRVAGEPTHEFHAVAPDCGFLRLPAPSPGDIFFDIEGHKRGVGTSLEYLFGYVTVDEEEPRYHQRWALKPADEKRMFVEFIDAMTERARQYPDMHIYHFAPYEPAALKRLACRHSVGQFELDELLHAERFVDLLQVTRQGLVCSVESYSIKKLEEFYEFVREEELPEASKALREVERLIELNCVHELNDLHRETVVRYNRDDCVSTLQLRDWLEGRREELIAQGNDVPRPGPPKPPSEERQEANAELQRVYDRLIADIEEQPQGELQEARWLLAHLLDYFGREERTEWWEFFRLKELDDDELIRERQAIVGLEFVKELEKQGKERVKRHRYRFPAQQCGIEEETKLRQSNGERFGEVIALDLQQRTIDIKKRTDTAEVHPHAIFAFNDPIGAEKQTESLLSFGDQLATQHDRGEVIQDPRYELLSRRPYKKPTTNNEPFSPAGGEGARRADEGVTQPDQQATQPPISRRALAPGPEEPASAAPATTTTTHQALTAARVMDHTILPIQGPPGAGKTYIGSLMIIALAATGKRIGITAVSHKVISNLLQAINKNSDTPLQLAHQGAKDAPDFITRLPNKAASLEALDEGTIVGGTAWLWSDAELENQLDYLFIDEAGQFSLAMAIAAGKAAKNIVLLGDPQQLDQPQKATHPEGADVAALSHILGEHSTMPADQGLFLEDTWRLHPEICEFTSEQYYEGRLQSRPGLERQEIFGDSPYIGTGLRFIPVEHTGNHNRSDEEVEAIVNIVHELTQHANNPETPVSRRALARGPNQLAEGGSGAQRPDQLLAGQKGAQRQNQSPFSPTGGEGARRADEGDQEPSPHQWSNSEGELNDITLNDIRVIAPYNAQVNALRRALPEGALVGTVDKFQGQEAPVVIYSLTSSTTADAPRGMEFLFNPNRLNVATSRARCLVVIVGSPALFEATCNSVKQLRLANGLCRYREMTPLTTRH